MDAFLGDIFNQDSELLDYVRKLFGYALNGHTREEIFVLLLGAGGKVSRLSSSVVEGQCRSVQPRLCCLLDLCFLDVK